METLQKDIKSRFAIHQPGATRQRRQTWLATSAILYLFEMGNTLFLVIYVGFSDILTVKRMQEN